jgi:four helix bundle protein
VEEMEVNENGIIRNFEDLEVWKRGCQLTRRIYMVTAGECFKRDYGLADQIRRASVSIPSNIAEGFEREALGDYRRFLLIAKGSCGEVRTQLYIAKSLAYLPKDESDDLISDCFKLSAMISNLIRTLPQKT